MSLFVLVAANFHYFYPLRMYWPCLYIESPTIGFVVHLLFGSRPTVPARCQTAEYQAHQLSDDTRYGSGNQYGRTLHIATAVWLSIPPSILIQLLIEHGGGAARGCFD